MRRVGAAVGEVWARAPITASARLGAALLPVVVLSALLGACKTSCPSGDRGGAVRASTGRALGGPRPAELRVPRRYDAARSWPLLVLLHGYGGDGSSQLEALGFSYLVDEVGVLLLAPDGTLDSVGHRFWNASDACCNFDRKGVDDVAYLAGLVEETARRYRVDRARVYAVGFSNGGFMAHRLACDRSALFSGVVSLAGAAPPGRTRCAPSHPVGVLQIHGLADEIVRYAGGRDLLSRGGPSYPGARASIARWAELDGCEKGGPTVGARFDLDHFIPGAETVPERHRACRGGTGVELWSMHGGGHSVGGGEAFARQVYDWLEAHRRK